jgi:hypothetical protein
MALLVAPEAKVYLENFEVKAVQSVLGASAGPLLKIIHNDFLMWRPGFSKADHRVS